MTKHITPMAFEPSLSADSLKGTGGTLKTMETPSTNGEPKSANWNKASVPESVTSAPARPHPVLAYLDVGG